MADSWKLNWGFCCAGKIANDFSIAMDSVLSKGHRKVAVAARNVSKAEEFSKKHKFERFYGSYDELALDADVEIVYVSSLHPQHFELCKLFLNNGKHVLCEKPMTMKLEQTSELVQLARTKQLFFMEGFWTRFFPTYQHAKQLCLSGEIGEVKQVQASFFTLPHSERMTNEQLGGSALFDIGVYPVTVADFFFGAEPSKVQSLSSWASNTVDESFLITLQYGSDKFATLSTSITCMRPNNTIICGSNGYIVIKPPMHASEELEVFKRGSSEPIKRVFPLDQSRQSECWYPNGNGFTYEIEHVRECLKEKKLLESPVMPLDATLRIARILDTVIKQKSQ